MKIFHSFFYFVFIRNSFNFILMLSEVLSRPIFNIFQLDMRAGLPPLIIHSRSASFFRWWRHGSTVSKRCFENCYRVLWELFSVFPIHMWLTRKLWDINGREMSDGKSLEFWWDFCCELFWEVFEFFEVDSFDVNFNLTFSKYNKFELELIMTQPCANLTYFFTSS